MRYLFLILVVAPTISVGQNIEIIGNCPLPNWVNTDISVSGNHAFISGNDINLQIVDVSDPYNPIFVSSYDTSGYSEALAVSGHYAYLTLHRTGLLIVDISEITNPAQIGVFQSPSSNYAHDVFVRKGLAYFANCTGNLRIIDVGDPSSPFQIGEYDSLICHEANGIFVVDEYAYLTEWIGGLYILDVSDPSDPVFIGNYQTNSITHGVHVAENYAYLKDEVNGLTIVDISDPHNPVPTGTWDVSDYSYFTGLYYSAGYVYLAHSSLSAIDVSDPLNPFLAGRIEEPHVRAVYVNEQYIYAACYGSLYILSFSPTEINEDIGELPNDFFLSQNHPNPFNAATTISYSLPESGRVSISICNILGQQVATIYDGMQKAGEHAIIWDATDFPSGVYFARLEAGEHSENIKMVLLK